MSTEKFVYVSYIDTTPAKVWQALMDGELTRQYWRHENLSDWKPGSPWRMEEDNAQRTLKHVGKVLECVPEKRLALTWAAPGEENDADRVSSVAIDIEPAGELVRVTVTHEKLNAHMLGKISFGWPLVLCSMKSFLETGRPLDFSWTASRAKEAPSHA